MGKTIQSILGYTGVRAATPPNLTVNANRPQPTFIKNFKVGDFWLYLPTNPDNAELYVLMSLAGNVADWVLIGTGNSTGIFTDFVNITNFTPDATSPADLDLIKTRSGGPIVAGDELGCVNFAGFDSSSLPVIAGSICVVNPATSTIGVDRVAGEMQFSTHPDSASGVTPTLRMTLDETGVLALNLAQNDNFGVNSPSFQVFGSSAVSINQANNSNGAVAGLFKQRVAAAVQPLDTIGTLNFNGYDGTNFITGASIRAVTRSTIAANRVPADLIIATHPDSTAAPKDRLTIFRDGNVGVSQADNDNLLGLTIVSFNVAGSSEISRSNDDTLATTGGYSQIMRTRNSGPITAGDTLGELAFAGYDSTSTPIKGASIISTNSGTIAANRVAGDLQFLTHPDSAGAQVLRMRIRPTGEVVILDPDSGVALTVTGQVSVGGDSGAGTATSTDFTNATAAAGGGAGAVALQAGGVGVAQAGWLKIYVNGVVSYVPYYQ